MADSQKPSESPLGGQSTDPSQRRRDVAGRDSCASRDANAVFPEYDIYRNGRPAGVTFTGRKRQRIIIDPDDAPPAKVKPTSRRVKSAAPPAKVKPSSRRVKPVAPPEKDICWVCRIGRHSPLRCMQTWEDTGMTAVCPIHPDQKDHILDDCYELLVYLSSRSLRERLFHWMCFERQGMPPIYTELIDVNELANLHGASPDIRPWSVGHSSEQWRQNRELLTVQLDYPDSTDIPVCCKEKDRQNVDIFQTVTGKRPKYGNLRSLVAHLEAEGELRQS
ncbi:hypothetical protein PG985_003323 [Apiospora marii]|uniref:uncharacterized protein n=1 Tax=Apiospora marii TaxID=335849 RepID=UPI0031315308